MAVFDDVILQSTLEIDKRIHLVTLTSTRIVLEACKKKKDRECATTELSYRAFSEFIDLNEVITARLDKPEPTKEKFKTTEGNKVYLCIEMRPLKPNTFSIYYIKRIPKHRWRYKQLTFMSSKYETCEMWVDHIQDLLNIPERRRPRHLLVFINPFGGKKKASKVYRDKVAPLFKLAGITTDIVVTTHRQHAHDVIQDYDITKIDGMVCVGGDGTFSEVLNGLIVRCNKDTGVVEKPVHDPAQPPLRIGIIPAGSTDAVVYTTTGINDAATSALHIIIGDSTGIDVCSLYNNGRFLKYNVTMMAYGFYGDVLEDSDRNRWMGPNRYNWSGLKKFLCKKSYDGEVSFLLSSDVDGCSHNRAHCWTGCHVCDEAAKRLAMEPDEKDELSEETWHTVKGKFVAVNSYSMSCRCQITPEGVSPNSHLGDGCIDLVLVFNCSRVDYLRHLYRCIDRNANQFDFEFVQVYRVKEFKFEPTSYHDHEEGNDNAASSLPEESPSVQNSVWNCDGDIIEFPSLHIKVHCQLLQLFARGVEEECKNQGTCCS